MQKYKIEKEFDYLGYKCIVTFNNMGFRCGYVGLPKEHSLYGKTYDDYLDIKKSDIGEKEISGIFPILKAMIDDDERVPIECYFECHGGITYSNAGKQSKYPINSDLWWFGFDCGHCDDGIDFELAIKYFPKFKKSIEVSKSIHMQYPMDDEIRTLEYVENECKHLADQLKSFENYEFATKED